MKKRSIFICTFLSFIYVSSALAVPTTMKDPTYSTRDYESTTLNEDDMLYMVGVYAGGTATVDPGNRYDKNTMIVISPYDPVQFIIDALEPHLVSNPSCFLLILFGMACLSIHILCALRTKA